MNRKTFLTRLGLGILVAPAIPKIVEAAKEERWIDIANKEALESFEKESHKMWAIDYNGFQITRKSYDARNGLSRVYFEAAKK